MGVPTKEHDISWRSRATEQPSAATNPQRSTKMAQVPTKDYQPEDDTPHILEFCPLGEEQRITGGADASVREHPSPRGLFYCPGTTMRVHANIVRRGEATNLKPQTASTKAAIQGLHIRSPTRAADTSHASSVATFCGFFCCPDAAGARERTTEKKQ